MNYIYMYIYHVVQAKVKAKVKSFVSTSIAFGANLSANQLSSQQNHQVCPLYNDNTTDKTIHHSLIPRQSRPQSRLGITYSSYSASSQVCLCIQPHIVSAAALPLLRSSQVCIYVCVQVYHPHIEMHSFI